MADLKTENSSSNNGQVHVELEAKRQSDSSWHPCQVFLRCGTGLAIKFEDQVLEDVIFDVEDVFSSLRVRSASLQGDDCCFIEGKHVLAACEENCERLFFDAVVEKVLRVRHSKRASCRCNFIIKKLFQYAGNETLTVPSGSIMKLAAESIKCHPVVAAFLNSKESSPSSTLMSSPAVIDETDSEIDLYGLLGKQIKEIGNLIGVSKKELVDDSFGDFADKEAQTKLLAPEHVSKLCVEVDCKKNQLRRSARKQKEIETEVEDIMITGEKITENKSPLNPLAARAVLASLVTKTSESVEFLHHKEGNHVHLDIMNGMMSRVYDSHPSFNTDSGPAKSVDDVEPLWKTEKGAAGKMHCAQNSRRELVMESGSYSSPLSAFRDEKTTQSVISGRLTRSATKRENKTSNGEVKSRILDEGVTFARVTRPGAHKRNANMDDEFQEALWDKSKRTTRSASAANQIEFGTSKIENNSKICDGKANIKNLRSTTRVTRSTALEGTATLNNCVKESLQDKSGIESALLDSDSELSEKRRGSELMGAVEINKKQKVVSNGVGRRQKATDGAAVCNLHANVETQSSKKPISSSNQLSQVSPQPTFRPRTRSHA